MSKDPDTLYNLALRALRQLGVYADQLAALPWLIRQTLMHASVRVLKRPVSPAEECLVLAVTVLTLASLVIFGAWFCLFVMDSFFRSTGYRH